MKKHPFFLLFMAASLAGCGRCMWWKKTKEEEEEREAIEALKLDQEAREQREKKNDIPDNINLSHHGNSLFPDYSMLQQPDLTLNSLLTKEEVETVLGTTGNNSTATPLSIAGTVEQGQSSPFLPDTSQENLNSKLTAANLRKCNAAQKQKRKDTPIQSQASSVCSPNGSQQSDIFSEEDIGDLRNDTDFNE